MAKKTKENLLDDLLNNLLEDNDQDKEIISDEEEFMENTNENDNDFNVDKESNTLEPQIQKSKTWFKTGEDAIEYAKQKAIVAQQKKERAVPIFHLKVGDEAIVVFVDDKGFGIHQHKVKIGDRWITLTCIKDFAPCPICATGNRSSYVIYYTAIDTRPYTDKDGKTTKFRKVLFPATGSTLQMRIADEKREKKSLIGAVLKFKRYGDRESSSGTLVENKGKIDIENKFGKEYTTPIDYLKVLAPPTEEELEALGFHTIVAGSEEDILGDLDV